MTTLEFFKKWNGQYCDFDHAFGAQCVDVIKQYFYDVLGMTPFKGNAIDYWNNPPAGFTKVAKTAFNTPPPFSIVIWNISPPYGHIGIVNWTRAYDFNCFEQNNPVGSPCHFQTHSSYKNVIGWLTPLPVMSLPHNPLTVLRIGLNLPTADAFKSQVGLYSSGKILCDVHDITTSVDVSTGMFTQEMAYDLMERLGIRERFVFIFYPPNLTSSFYASYYYPKRDCMITTCPGTEARLLAFEFSHQLQMYFNVHHGSNTPVQVVDSNFPTDELIKSKYDSVSKYYL